MKINYNILFATVICSLLLNLNVQANTPMNREPAFKSGEKITYTASYALGFLYTDVAEVSLGVNAENNQSNQFKITAKGNTYSFYDKFFKVRDLYEARFQMPGFKSTYFHRDVYEGGYTVKNTYAFDWENHEINGTVEKKKGTNTVNIPMDGKQPFDVLTSLYYFRNIDFEKGKVNTVYPISVMLDDSIYTIGCKYAGKEVRKIKAMNAKVNCLKLQLEVIAGEVFKGAEVITIWVSDDHNHIPLEMEFPIRIGKVKARIQKYENLKYPINFADK